MEGPTGFGFKHVHVGFDWSMEIMGSPDCPISKEEIEELSKIVMTQVSDMFRPVLIKAFSEALQVVIHKFLKEKGLEGVCLNFPGDINDKGDPET